MGALQTYFYLAIVGGIMLGLTLLFILIAAVGLVRFHRDGGSRLTVTLIGAALLLTLVLVAAGTYGAAYAFARYGAA